MRSSQWLWLSFALFALGCSQKDPDEGPVGGNKGDAGGGGAVADDYYPMVAGSTLIYRHSGDGAPWDDRTEVRATQYMGKAAYITEGAPDPKGETSKNTITRDGTRLYRAYKEELKGGNVQGTVEYVPGFIRFDAAWTDVDEGFSENITYTRIEKTAAGSVIAEDNREHTFTVEKLGDSVTVAAGTFDDCIRVRRTRVRGSASTNSSDDDDKVFWFCAGIGKVKELSDIGGGTEELVSCDIPGGLCP